MSTSSQIADFLANTLLNRPGGLRTQDLMDLAGVKVSRQECIHRLSDDARVVRTGKGRGLRWFHVNHAPSANTEEVEKAEPHRRRARLEAARRTILSLVRERGSIRSTEARTATGLNVNAARYLLDGMVARGTLSRHGQGRRITYRLAVK